eukprot:gene30885-42489_t
MLGTLPRLKIENLLLCEITQMMDIPQIPKKQAQVPYKPIATAYKTTTVQPNTDES